MKRILVVDDEPDTREMLKYVLEQCRASVKTCNSVSGCLEIFKEWNPNLIISDIGMPDEDGFDLVQQVRDAGYTAQQLPAVALTAFANKVHADRALKCGFQMHIRKPVDASDLITAIAGLAGRTA